MTNYFFSNLDAVGFVWLIHPPDRPRGKQQIGDQEIAFSYFTHVIEVEKIKTAWADETWTCLPIDGVWGFMKASGVTSAGPCLFQLSENAEGQPVRTSQSLARHWCPIVFDDKPVE